MPGKGNLLKVQIIKIGKRLYDLRLAAAHSGNLSARFDRNNILITATGCSLGALKFKDIIKVNLEDKADIKNRRLSSEFPLHRLIYKNFNCQRIIHCHPPFANGYFAAYPKFKGFTPEAKVYLRDIPVVKVDTPTITKPGLVIEALKKSNLAVIRNHGVVCMGRDFPQALYLIETLEEAVKVKAIARLFKFKKKPIDTLDVALKENLSQYL